MRGRTVFNHLGARVDFLVPFFQRLRRFRVLLSFARQVSVLYGQTVVRDLGKARRTVSFQASYSVFVNSRFARHRVRNPDAA